MSTTRGTGRYVAMTVLVVVAIAAMGLAALKVALYALHGHDPLTAVVVVVLAVVGSWWGVSAAWETWRAER